jgi:5'-3' exoribonuclease 2
MCDMLFVNGSHPLSPYIYSLNSKFGHLPDKRRNEIKEKLDPSARLAKLNIVVVRQVILFC